MSYLFIKKICFKEKSLYYFHKKLKIKRTQNPPKKIFGGFLRLFFFCFFLWVFYCQPCLLLAQEFLLGDAEVLQARALSPPLGRRLLALLHHLNRRPVWCGSMTFWHGSGSVDPYLWPVFRIHDILVWIRIRGSMPLTNGSGSWIWILLFSSLTFKIPAKN